MSEYDDKLAEIEKKRIELEAQLREMKDLAEVARKEKEEYDRKKALEEPLTVRVRELTAQHQVLFQFKTRLDITQYIRASGHLYFSQRTFDQQNKPIEQWYCHLGKWDGFLSGLRELPNVSVIYNAGIEENLKSKIEAPAWRISHNETHIILEPRFDTSANLAYSINGARHSYGKYLAPLTEAQAVWEAFVDKEDVVFEESTKSFLVAQIEAAIALDRIALQTDAPEIHLPLPDGFSPYPFQRVGIKFAKATSGSLICADEMGLGKSLQALGYDMLEPMQDKRMTIIICPASLKSNWMREIIKWTGTVPFPVVHSNPDANDMVELMINKPRYIIINYDLLARVTKVPIGDSEKAFTERFLWIELINAAKPNQIIIDEGHYIKNTDSNRSKAVRSLTSRNIMFLTGTPVLNRPGELWPMLTMIKPDLFPAKETFISQYTYDGMRVKNQEQLRKVLRGVMIRRLKKDVVKDLPPIRRINEYYELSPRAKKLYEKVLAGVYERVAAYDPRGVGGDNTTIVNVLESIMRLKQICAIDKTSFTTDLATNIVDSAENGHKILLFTQFKPVAYALTQKLGREAIGFVSRKENQFRTADNNERYQMVDRFTNDPDIRFLVATEKTTKEGMNITAAKTIIFNDLFWTPAAHAQAEGRAYGRLSDLHSIDSYYIIAETDIEEWIVKLLQAKMKVINEVVEKVSEDRAEDESIVKELIRLMKGKMGI